MTKTTLPQGIRTLLMHTHRSLSFLQQHHEPHCYLRPLLPTEKPHLPRPTRKAAAQASGLPARRTAQQFLVRNTQIINLFLLRLQKSSKLRS